MIINLDKNLEFTTKLRITICYLLILIYYLAVGFHIVVYFYIFTYYSNMLICLLSGITTSHLLSWIYIYFLFISYFLLFTSISPLLLMLLCLCHMLLSNSIHLFSFSIFLIKPYLFITFPLPFHYLSIAFSKVWLDIHPFIVPSHFLSFSCSHFILLSSLSLHPLTLSDPKGCAGLFSYSHYLWFYTASV